LSLSLMIFYISLVSSCYAINAYYTGNFKCAASDPLEEMMEVMEKARADKRVKPWRWEIKMCPK